MSADLIAWISSFLSNTYQLLNSVYFPATSWSIWSLMVGVTSITVLLGILRSVFGVSVNTNPHYGTGGNNKDLKISKDRKGDTK